MKTKLVAVAVLLGMGVLAVGVIRTGSTIQKQNVPYKDRLKWYARDAKSRGQQKVRVPAPLVEYLGGAGTITSEEAFSSSTVVIAHVIYKQSYPRNDDIVTWNKFAIDEVLSQAKELPCPGCVLPDVPSTFLPLQSGEFLIPKTGGTVNIDGVDIEQTDDTFPEYQFNQSYLLLINLYPTGAARTFGGPVGVFKVENGKVLPIRDTEHRIKKDFKETYGNSLDRLKRHLKRK